MNSTYTQTPRVAGHEIISINPATLVELGRVPILGDKEIKQSLAKARTVQPAWAALTFKQRAGYTCARSACCLKIRARFAS
jgi:acyl-CoA reductase-like NAD-dependent aldehyde dehydrogenase